MMSNYRSQTSDPCCQHHREDQWQWLELKFFGEAGQQEMNSYFIVKLQNCGMASFWSIPIIMLIPRKALISSGVVGSSPTSCLQ